MILIGWPNGWPFAPALISLKESGPGGPEILSIAAGEQFSAVHLDHRRQADKERLVERLWVTTVTRVTVPTIEIGQV